MRSTIATLVVLVMLLSETTCFFLSTAVKRWRQYSSSKNNCENKISLKMSFSDSNSPPKGANNYSAQFSTPQGFPLLFQDSNENTGSGDRQNYESQSSGIIPISPTDLGGNTNSNILSRNTLQQRRYSMINHIPLAFMNSRASFFNLSQSIFYLH